MLTMKIKNIITGLCITFLSTFVWKIWQNQPSRPILMNKEDFSVLSGWEHADLKLSFLAFRNSCKLFLKQNPEQNVGNSRFRLKAKDWHPICHAAKYVNTYSKYHLRAFFQAWFKPVAVTGDKPASGTFTGYYAASVEGSPTKTDKYTFPVINHTKNDLTLAWVGSQKDLRTLITEGSAVIHFTDGTTKAIEYIKGSGSSASFQETNDKQFHGAQDVTLTPGYSMAIDRQWIPLGTPLWLMTDVRQDFSKKAQPFKRLMIAQDIGSAIRGAVRGDMYWGPGRQATKIASNIKNQGSYWLLLPRTAKI